MNPPNYLWKHHQSVSWQWVAPPGRWQKRPFSISWRCSARCPSCRPFLPLLKGGQKLWTSQVTGKDCYAALCSNRNQENQAPTHQANWVHSPGPDLKALPRRRKKKAQRNQSANQASVDQVDQSSKGPQTYRSKLFKSYQKTWASPNLENALQTWMPKNILDFVQWRQVAKDMKRLIQKT